MNIKQIINGTVFSVLLFAVSVVSILAVSTPVSADPATTEVKCVNGKKVTAKKDMKDDKSILDDKDYTYACRNNGGYKKIDETIVCNDDTQQNVYKSAVEPKDKLDDKDRETACRGHGGIKEDEETPAESGDLENPIEGEGCGGVKTAIIKCDADSSGTDLENNGVWALLVIVLNILTAGVGIFAVAGIVYGAVLYTTAEDKADQVKKATDIITNVVIGLVAFALMWAGLNFIVPGGIFN